jgi:hypothetical protein
VEKWLHAKLKVGLKEKFTRPSAGPKTWDTQEQKKDSPDLQLEHNLQLGLQPLPRGSGETKMFEAMAEKVEQEIIHAVAENVQFGAALWRCYNIDWGVDDEKNWIKAKLHDEALKALGDRIKNFQCSKDVDGSVMELFEAEARKVAGLLADVDEANELISKRRLLELEGQRSSSGSARNTNKDADAQMSQIPELDDQKERLCLLKAWHAAAREGYWPILR